MSLADFIEKSKGRLATQGTDALGPIAKDFASSALVRVFKRLDPDLGYRIYDRDWNVLLILDAARADMYFEIAGRGRAELSCASASTEWIGKNFSEEYRTETRETAYVTANPHSNQLDPADFGLLDEVWRADWDTERGTIPPQAISDHGIAAARSDEYDRVVLHYMQPHFPFIGADTQFGRMKRDNFGYGVNTENVWPRVQTGELDRKAVIDAYRANHRYIYDHVQQVLENVEGIVAITADHANALGEWGVWGHRQYLPVPAIRTVPWDVRACTDARTYDPGEVEPATRGGDGGNGNNGSRDGRDGGASGENATVADRLRQLGYRE
jgi:hypothetical protein